METIAYVFDSMIDVYQEEHNTLLTVKIPSGAFTDLQREDIVDPRYATYKTSAFIVECIEDRSKSSFKELPFQGCQKRYRIPFKNEYYKVGGWVTGWPVCHEVYLSKELAEYGFIRSYKHCKTWYHANGSIKCRQLLVDGCYSQVLKYNENGALVLHIEQFEDDTLVLDCLNADVDDVINVMLWKQEHTALFKEELMQTVFHPDRVERMGGPAWLDSVD